MRVLGIDYGKKKVGVAIGNTETMIATPFLVLENKNFDYLSEEILKIANEWGVETIVFGLPLNMNNSHKINEIYNEVLKFIDFFKKKTLIKFELFDERLSTFEAKERLSLQNLSYKKTLEKKDSVSAQIILEKWLNLRA